MAKVLWTQKQDMGPRPRIGHAMTYDAPRRCVVLFGGDSLANATFGDTWEWDGDSWTQVQDIGPAARAFHAMAFDGTRRRTVLFGGRNHTGLLGDTWEWDGENWTQVADSGPASRHGHAMAFDLNRQRIVLFGGDANGRLNDTWEWDGNEWVQQGDSGPSPRIHPAMAYDTGRSRLVLFGGAAQDLGLGDTWEWDGTAWTEESDFGPDPCAGGAMVFKGSRAALFGGMASIAAPPPQPAPALFDRSWEWDGRHWTARQDMGPGNRVFHAMAFDESRSRIVLFGGSAAPIGGENAAAKPIRDFHLQQYRAEHPEDRAAEVRAEHADGGNPQRRRRREGDVEHADHEVGGPDGLAEALRLLPDDPAQCDRPQPGAHSARGVQHADAGRRSAGERKDPLAENRQ